MTADQNMRELSSNFEHDLFSIAAAGSITLNMGRGTDTATNRYLDLPDGVSYGLDFFPTVACSITEINGRVLKVAFPIGTGGWKPEHGKFTSIKIQAGGATVISVFGKN